MKASQNNQFFIANVIMWGVFFLTSIKMMLLIPYAINIPHSLILLIFSILFLFLSHYSFKTGMNLEKRRLLMADLEEDNSLELDVQLVKNYIKNKEARNQNPTRRKRGRPRKSL